MKAKEIRLLQFLQNSRQFIIPIYQRTYSWTETECEQLWKDILRSGADNTVAGHFLGSVVYIEQGLSMIADQSPLMVIDGQQRLTSVTLLLEAFARALGNQNVEELNSARIRSYFLSNPLEDGDKRYKLLLTQTDRNSLISLVENTPRPQRSSDRIFENFEYFSNRIGALDDWGVLANGLKKLSIVEIALDRQQDNPQLIFESMNSTGRELTQADLIRNFVLMGLEPNLQTNIYRDYWRPMEEIFGQQAYGAYFDDFMRHYLTVKTGSLPRISDVYDVFKKYARDQFVNETTIRDLVADIHKYARYYCNIALGQEPDPALKRAFADLRELKVDTAYPFLLEAYADFKNGVITIEDYRSLANTIETHVFRRAVCAIPTNSLNKTFATLAKMIDKQNYLQSTQAYLLALPSYRRFPKDAEFKEHLTTRDMYNFQRRSYWFRKMENRGRKEFVEIDEYSIEHILPQNERLSQDWQRALGSEWRLVQEKYLHTVGNLTLTGYNSEYSDRSFSEKREIVGGFKESPLQLNKGLASLDTWNPSTIEARAESLSRDALDVWPTPQVPQSMLKKKPTEVAKSKSTYSIADHPHIASGTPMRAVFDVLRREILALDPSINEEFLKLYVAYKAESNFVDIVPQVNSLRLSLNMPYPDIRDPRGLTQDISNIGRWGNGEVELRVRSLGDIPYAIGLIRQSLERQLDTVEGDPSQLVELNAN